ncbi:MAG: tRNA (guanosine(37)-N1)-methyltransferase TrmD [Nitrospinae bacterium]|nr:tRNA (guanosine(37)-N1)-methyltransferase TrmD [Nitrospinota bacterium]
MRFDIISIFPEMFESPFAASIIRRAVDSGAVAIHTHNLRDWTEDRHHITDDYPYGGGPGMVMKVEPLARAVEALREKNPGAPVALLTPQGTPFNQTMARALAANPGLILVCGRYEGVDERVRAHYCDLEISIGDYVLTGGELPAMVVVDALTRLVPGVLGTPESADDESHSTGLLEYPHYTRPAEFKGLRVPDILLSGDHAKIEDWRRAQAIIRTARRRPDLISRAGLTDAERLMAEKIIRGEEP